MEKCEALNILFPAWILFQITAGIEGDLATRDRLQVVFILVEHPADAGIIYTDISVFINGQVFIAGWWRRHFSTFCDIRIGGSGQVVA
ncbi:hypothetical protein DF182_05710 [Chitinophaga flava]|uniref:Uncharacterized protein n=1 Tax=Chitinophaga flava TaxID=2259036 RepID=A0A365Y0G5_9BACT|nr:hypothetical protein DF182_05710 [Chitinophaga flava]